MNSVLTIAGSTRNTGPFISNTGRVITPCAEIHCNTPRVTSTRPVSNQHAPCSVSLKRGCSILTTRTQTRAVLSLRVRKFAATHPVSNQHAPCQINTPRVAHAESTRSGYSRPCPNPHASFQSPNNLSLFLYLSIYPIKFLSTFHIPQHHYINTITPPFFFTPLHSPSLIPLLSLPFSHPFSF